jgi:hypothetical protein
MIILSPCFHHPFQDIEQSLPLLQSQDFDIRESSPPDSNLNDAA